MANRSEKPPRELTPPPDPEREDTDETLPETEEIPFDGEMTDEELLAAVTEESGKMTIPRRPGWPVINEVDLAEYRVGRVVFVDGRTRYIKTPPYSLNGKYFVDLVLRLRDLKDPSARNVTTIAVTRVTLTYRERTHAQGMHDALAREKTAQGLGHVLSTEEIRYRKMSEKRQRQIAEDPVFAEYVKKFPHGAEIFYKKTIPCTVKLSPKKTEEGKILVIIQSDSRKSAGFSTKVVPIEEIILRSEAVQY